MELVSVIIPVFNSERFVTDAIDSVVAQHYPAIEIIIVDDGSTDRTVTVAREQLEKHGARYKVLELGTNVGPSAARNAALRIAAGSWVQFLDSDDVLLPHKIERQMAVCATASPDVVAVCSPWRWGFYESGRIDWQGPLQPFVPGRAPIMCLADGRPLLGACLVRRTTLEQVGGFDEALRFWECEELCVRLSMRGSFSPAPPNDAEYLWRLHRDAPYIGGASARYTSKIPALGWITQILKVTGNQSIDTMHLPPADRRLVMDECTLWGRMLFLHDRQAFREYVRLAKILDPQVVPSYPSYVSALARVVGYEGAETVGKLARTPRAWLRSAVYALKLRRRPHSVLEIS